MEIVVIMTRRKINCISLISIKWVDERAKELDNLGLKHWCTDKVSSRNEVGIIVDTESKKDIMDVTRIGDHIIAIKFRVNMFLPPCNLGEFRFIPL